MGLLFFKAPPLTRKPGKFVLFLILLRSYGLLSDQCPTGHYIEKRQKAWEPRSRNVSSKAFFPAGLRVMLDIFVHGVICTRYMHVLCDKIDVIVK